MFSNLLLKPVAVYRATGQHTLNTFTNPIFLRRHACGDSRLLNPVALVENHPACRKNEKGWGILPNQLVWKPHLILLLLSSKLLAQTDSLLKIQQNGDGGRNAQAQAMRMLLGGSRKMPPIPYLIANFIQKKSVSRGSHDEGLHPSMTLVLHVLQHNACAIKAGVSCYGHEEQIVCGSTSSNSCAVVCLLQLCTRACCGFRMVPEAVVCLIAASQAS